MSDVTRILQSIDSGDSKAAEELLPIVYEELRRLAAAKIAKETPGQTLQPTALVHEAWLRLTGGEKPGSWQNRAHFFSAAAEAMRRILIDIARRKKAERHGGGQEHLNVHHLEIAAVSESEELLAVHEALDGLSQVDALAADLVKLRYFVGMTMEQAAAALEIPLRSTERLWSFARAWIRKEMDPKT